MSLRSEAKRVEVGTQVGGLANVATSLAQRLTTLNQQFIDLRAAAVADVNFVQADLDEIDAVRAQVRTDIRAAAQGF